MDAVSSARLKDWTYTTTYRFTSDSSFNLTDEVTTDSYLVTRFPKREDCYNVIADINAADFPTRVSGRFCTRLGINATLEVLEQFIILNIVYLTREFNKVTPTLEKVTPNHGGRCVTESKWVLHVDRLF